MSRHQNQDGFKIITGLLESAKAYFTLVNPLLSTGDKFIDACVFFSIPLALPVIYRISDDGLQTLWRKVLYFYNGRYVVRSITTSKTYITDFSMGGGPAEIPSRGDRNDTMQRAISMYLAETLDLTAQREGEIVCIAPSKRVDAMKMISIIDQLKAIKMTIFPAHRDWVSIGSTGVGFRQLRESNSDSKDGKSNSLSHEVTFEFRAKNPDGAGKIKEVLDVNRICVNFEMESNMTCSSPAGSLGSVHQ